MIGLSQIIKGLQHPHLAFRALNRRYHYRKNGTDYNTAGTDIFNEDWDNLILLDACRYDLFKKANQIEGRLEKRESRGSDTVEFLRGNFRERILHDTVYITASPMLYRHRQDINVEFHKIVDIWNNGGWSEEEMTVLPQPVTEAAIEAAERYPNKRLFVHYLQPHYPFVGSDNRPFRGGDAFVDRGRGSWTRIAMGEIETTRADVWNAYRDNLEYVLKSVSVLVNTLGGKTVVTSDHGNLLDERGFPILIREWGHPRGLHVPDLVSVPWFVIEDKKRREIVSELPETAPVTEADASTVKERLARLGYADAD